jgi:hypothetical protein
MFLKLKISKNKIISAVAMLTLLMGVTIFSSCNEAKDSSVIEPAFYYWKTVFKLTDFEKQRLDSLQVKTIYIKIFDVDWDETTGQALPKAVIRFADSSFKPFKIIPTFFLTNECIKKIDSLQIPAVAEKIMQLTKQIIVNNNFKEIPEIQIDCDWTAGTKEKYFSLLRDLKKLNPNAAFSATIRLHQIKFMGKTGVPPVDKGLLMCYNMGNLKNLATKNSIIETAELKKYVGNLSHYPLALDVALPLFDWKVLFRKNIYTGLIENLPDAVFTNSFSTKKDNRYKLLKDTLLQGYDLKKGDVLRSEQSDYAEILSAASEINKRLQNTRPRVSLYHLDSVILNKYTLHELETIYSSMR